MPVYKAPVEDAMFLLNDVLDIGDTTIYPASRMSRSTLFPPFSAKAPGSARKSCCRSTQAGTAKAAAARPMAP